ncbi:MAG: flagellar hook-basal body complex protein FliE [Phycisphaerae bacterium]
MGEPISPAALNAGLERARAAGGAAAPRGTEAAGGAAKSFGELLSEGLEKVNAMQQAADAGVQKLLTGESDNVSEVLGMIRKSDVAFSLLVEIRNKLMDAYNELKQMRV